VEGFAPPSRDTLLAPETTMNHSGDVASSSESAFILRALEADLRVDGRTRTEVRPAAVSFGKQLGSVEVHVGDTKVMAVATAELVEPYPDRPAEGMLQFFVEFSPMASPAFEVGRPTEAAVELMRLIERSLRRSQAIDVESLCVVAGRRVWSVRMDVIVLDHHGNLADSASLAALAALKHLRLPAVSITGAGDEAIVRTLTAEQAEPQSLVFHHMPVAVTIGLFRAASDGALLCAVDPTDREELVMLGSVVVVLNQFDEVCALEKPGGLPIQGVELLDCMRRAKAVAPQMLSALDGELTKHAAETAARAATLSRTGRATAAESRTAELPLSIPVAPSLTSKKQKNKHG